MRRALESITDSLMKTPAPDEMKYNALIFSGDLFDGYLIGTHVHAGLESHSSCDLNLFSRKSPERHSGSKTR